MTYLTWDSKKIDTHDHTLLTQAYDQGYVATRVEKGLMNMTRSVRIRLSDYEPSSENRRILRKVENVHLEIHPIPYKDYHWSIHKLAKDFYTTKFGEDTFSANKIKELITDADKSSFNTLLVYSCDGKPISYCIGLLTQSFLHYSYPFYDQETAIPSLGLGMMTRAIEWAKERGLTYIYLGSLQRPSDTYKLQFSGLEWFDGKEWKTDITPLKTLLV